MVEAPAPHAATPVIPAEPTAEAAIDLANETAEHVPLAANEAPALEMAAAPANQQGPPVAASAHAPVVYAKRPIAVKVPKRSAPKPEAESNHPPRRWLRPTGIGASIAAVIGVAVAAVSMGSDGRVPLTPARGELRYQGKAIPGALVTFHPFGEGGKKAGVPHPHGVVNADGTFQLGTYSDGDGAPPGEYEVTVHWFVKARKDEEGPGKNALPLRFGNTETSGVKVRVQAGENALPPIQLGG